MANKLIQIKASGMMCSFWTMSVEKALKRLDGVESVQVNLVHGIILVEGDPARVAQEQVATKVEELGYTVVATEAQQMSTDEVLISTMKRRSFLAMGLAALFGSALRRRMPDPAVRRCGTSGGRTAHTSSPR